MISSISVSIYINKYIQNITSRVGNECVSFLTHILGKKRKWTRESAVLSGRELFAVYIFSVEWIQKVKQKIVSGNRTKSREKLGVSE